MCYSADNSKILAYEARINTRIPVLNHENARIMLHKIHLMMMDLSALPNTTFFL